MDEDFITTDTECAKRHAAIYSVMVVLVTVFLAVSAWAWAAAVDAKERASIVEARQVGNSERLARIETKVDRLLEAKAPGHP